MKKGIITLFFVMAFVVLGYGQQKKASYTFVISPKFVGAGYFSNKVAPIAVDYNKWSYVGNTGNVLFEPMFRTLHEFVDGCAVYEKKYGEYGIMNLDIGTVLPLNMAEATAEHFSEGLLAVKMSNGWGYVDKTGRIVVNGQYKSIWTGDFHTQRIKVYYKSSDITTVVWQKFRNFAASFNQ